MKNHAKLKGKKPVVPTNKAIYRERKAKPEPDNLPKGGKMKPMGSKHAKRLKGVML